MDNLRIPIIACLFISLFLKKCIFVGWCCVASIFFYCLALYDTSWNLGWICEFSGFLFYQQSRYISLCCDVSLYYVVIVALGEVMILLARWLHVQGGDNGIGNPSIAGKWTMIQFHCQINIVSMACFVSLK